MDRSEHLLLADTPEACTAAAKKHYHHSKECKNLRFCHIAGVCSECGLTPALLSILTSGNICINLERSLISGKKILAILKHKAIIVSLKMYIFSMNKWAWGPLVDVWDWCTMEKQRITRKQKKR